MFGNGASKPAQRENIVVSVQQLPYREDRVLASKGKSTVSQIHEHHREELLLNCVWRAFPQLPAYGQSSLIRNITPADCR
jgi:hypothetical protein